MTPEGKRHTHSRNDITDMLIDMRLKQGYSRYSLIQFLIAPPYNYDKDTAGDYVRWAAKEFEARAICNFGEDLKEDIERWESDRELCLAANDRKGAAECLVHICKLKGHYVERTQVNGAIDYSVKTIYLNGPKEINNDPFDPYD